MSRALALVRRLCLCAAVLLPCAGCGLLHGDPCCPNNQSWRCQDDPRIGSCELGCGWVNPWDDLCEDVVIVGASGCHGCRPCASGIACDLEAQGISSRVIGKHQVNLAARDLFANFMSGCSRSPIVIVGCGGGVDDAIRLCRILQIVNISVDKLILVENTCCTCVPCNVVCCVNLYYSTGGTLHCGGKEICTEGEYTQIQNLDLSECGEKPALCGCSDCARLLAVEHVLALVPPSMEQPAP